MRLMLDLAHPQPRPSLLGWLLLGLGITAALWAGWRYADEGRRLEVARAEIAALSPKPARSTRRIEDPAKESAMAKNARRALEADWAGLLARLEHSRPERIALLAVEADAAQGHLNLEANAKDLQSMLEYLEGLEAAGLRQPRLQSHVAMEEDSQGYIHFTATAGWGAPGGKP